MLSKLTYRELWKSLVISRMDLAANTIRWMKNYSSSYSISTGIIGNLDGLALNPAEDKIAVHVIIPYTGAKEGILFVIRSEDGGAVTK